MNWTRDNTGRFPYRPYYEVGEIDYACEKVIFQFFMEKYGSISYPIDTNDLTILLEQQAGELDIFADLSSYGPSVEGVTEFYSNKKPKVSISRELSRQAYRENRYRTTLAHELGHVHLHSFLLLGGQKKLFTDDIREVNHCKRANILNATKTDWMEWQAGYASGAFLIPITPLIELVKTFYQSNNSLSVGSVISQDGKQLILEVSNAFQVSEDAARVRLLQLNYLSEQQKSPHF